MKKNPEISINQLGKFVHATDAKKRSILKNMKYPATFINAMYRSPQSAFVNFMLDSTHDIGILQDKKTQVQKRVSKNDYQLTAKNSCIAGLNKLISIATGAELPSYFKYRSQGILPKHERDMMINGVLIHTSPDVILVGKSTSIVRGAIKLVFSKGKALTGQEGTTISECIKVHLEQLYGIPIKGERCITIDVFAERFFYADDSMHSIRTSIVDACGEINSMWPSIAK